MITPTYSHLFSCIFDQPAPIGQLGRGAHYSIFRSVQWRSIKGDPLTGGRVHDFAVIWDEDHDARIISVIERLHLAGLLWPIIFIGERKGVVTIILSRFIGSNLYLSDIFLEEVKLIASGVEDDSWCCDIGWFEQEDVLEEPVMCDGFGIINTDDWRVSSYLKGIDALWRLG